MELFTCQQKGCGQQFKSESRLKKHKDQDRSHNYCKKCDELFDEWVDMLLHKNLRDDHMSCKFCGQDFRTLSGLERHVKLDHPPKHDIKCQGCGKSFTRGSTLIGHLEQNQCPGITARQFISSIQHKLVVHKILNDNSTMDSVYSQLGGGVPLASLIEDKHDHAAVSPHERASTTIAPQQKWPSLSSSAEPLDPETSLDQDFAALALNDQDSSRVHSRNISTTSNTTAMTVDSLQTSASSRTSIASPIGSPTVEDTNGSAKSSHAVHTTPPESVHAAATAPTPSSLSSARPAWVRNGNAANQLFPQATPTPATGVWADRLNAGHEQNKNTNMLTTRFWDPSSKGYNPDNFYDSTTEAYACPLVGCRMKFPVPIDLEIHIQQDHATIDHRCYTCRQPFKSAQRLMVHYEDPIALCWVSRADHFGDAVDIASGGFLQVKDSTRRDMEIMPRIEYGPGSTEPGRGLTHAPEGEEDAIELPGKATYKQRHNPLTAETEIIKVPHAWRYNHFTSSKPHHWDDLVGEGRA